MSHPTLWLALCLLAAGTATAQPRPPSRERQDRRTSLALAPTELRVAANNITTVVLNGPLDRDSLVVDRTRFKWAEVSDQMLILQPFADLGSGERRIALVVGPLLPGLTLLAVWWAWRSPADSTAHTASQKGNPLMSTLSNSLPVRAVAAWLCATFTIGCPATQVRPPEPGG